MTTQNEYDSTQPSSSGGFLKRLLLAFLKLSLLFIIIAVLAAAGWLIYLELDRSFDSVGRRIEFNTGRVDTLEDDFEALADAGAERQEQVEALQTAIADQEASMSTLASNLDAVQKEHEEDLATLEEQLNALLASTGTISGNLTVLNAGLVALQQDSTTNRSDIDALGGEVDALQGDLAGLLAEVEGVQAELSDFSDDFSAEEFNRMGQALSLFRVWELVSRARLRLFEQNLGLAAVDIEAALALVDRLLVTAAEEEETTTAGLVQVQQRLTLAAAALPDDLVAARDLETAWQLLDTMLAELFGEEPLSPEEATSSP